MNTIGNRWALVTGVSAGGLGDALTMELLHHSINVIATGLHLRDLDYLVSVKSAELVKLELDVSSSESIVAAVKETRRITNGRLDFLLSMSTSILNRGFYGVAKITFLADNAGYGYMMPLLDASITSIKNNFAVNVFGVLEMTQAFFPLLRSAQGIVVNQCSIAGLPGITQPFIGSYSASKSAMMALSDTLRLELLPFGIKVVTLVTGDVKTQFWKNADRSFYQGLSKQSLYMPIGAHVEAMMKGETNPPGQQSPHIWAVNVVSDLLKSSDPPDVVRRGHLATVTWLASSLLPNWTLRAAFWRSSNLIELTRILQQQDSHRRD